MKLLFSVAIASFYGLTIHLLFGLFDGAMGIMSLSFFFIVPFLIGYLTVFLIRYKETETASRAFFLPWLSTFVILFITLCFGSEGRICWMMAFPLFAIVAGLGGVLAFNRKKRRAMRKEEMDFLKDDWDKPGSLKISFLFMLPLLAGFLEGDRTSSFEDFTVTKQIEVQAPPDSVWNTLMQDSRPVRTHSATLSTLLGFPHHLSTTLNMPVVGGTRLATYEKGLVFMETIRKIEPGRLMVVEIKTDPSKISKAIMDEHIVIGGKHIQLQEDDYQLTPLPNGRTLLSLSSHFSINTPFNWYAGLWAKLLMSDVLKEELKQFIWVTVQSQSGISLSPSLRKTADSLQQALILDSLNSLFSQIKTGKIDPALIGVEDSALNASIFSSFRGMEDHATRQVINVYPLSPQQYSISIAFLGKQPNQPGQPDSTVALQAILTVVAGIHQGKVSFSTPLSWLTRNWQKKQVGNITYYYQGVFHETVAKNFDRNNSRMAGRLGLPPEKFRFYLTDNYQEILQLQGYTFDLRYNGRTRGGYFDISHTIFAIQHSEDFSHDVFHYYASKVRSNQRNATADEGMAYSWGNAYYTDANGQMITQQALAAELRRYLTAHPSASLWTLFTDNPKILTQLAPEISVKSVISGLLCAEVDRQKGIQGLKALIDCGPGDENYLRVINELIGVNRGNFDEKVRELVASRRPRFS
jgi:hypothetical protein